MYVRCDDYDSQLRIVNFGLGRVRLGTCYSTQYCTDYCSLQPKLTDERTPICRAHCPHQLKLHSHHTRTALSLVLLCCCRDAPLHHQNIQPLPPPLHSPLTHPLCFSRSQMKIVLVCKAFRCFISF